MTPRRPYASCKLALFNIKCNVSMCWTCRQYCVTLMGEPLIPFDVPIVEICGCGIKGRLRSNIRGELSERSWLTEGSCFDLAVDMLRVLSLQRHFDDTNLPHTDIHRLNTTWAAYVHGSGGLRVKGGLDTNCETRCIYK